MIVDGVHVDVSEDEFAAPGAVVTVDRDHSGAVGAGKVVVLAGVSFRGHLEADEVSVEGTLDAFVKAGTLVVHEGGNFLGEAYCDLVRVAGRVRGIVVSDRVLVRRSADVRGYVLAGSLGAEPGAGLRAMIYAEPGVHLVDRHIQKARRDLSRTPLSVALVHAGPPVEDDVEPARADRDPADPSGRVEVVPDAAYDRPVPVATVPDPDPSAATVRKMPFLIEQE